MLRQFQQETYHGKGFDLSLEEVIVRGIGDYRGFTGFIEAAFQNEAMKRFAKPLSRPRSFHSYISGKWQDTHRPGLDSWSTGTTVSQVFR